MSIARLKDHLLRSFEEAKKLFGNQKFIEKFGDSTNLKQPNERNETGDNISPISMAKHEANIYYPFKFSEKQRVRRFIPSWSPYVIGLMIIFVAIAFVCV